MLECLSDRPQKPGRKTAAPLVGPNHPHRNHLFGSSHTPQTENGLGLDA
jgi:hypothetical protein